MYVTVRLQLIVLIITWKWTNLAVILLLNYNFQNNYYTGHNYGIIMPVLAFYQIKPEATSILFLSLHI